jgi:hypothetical protein
MRTSQEGMGRVAVMRIESDVPNLGAKNGGWFAFGLFK